MPPSSRSTWKNIRNIWHVFWRIARSNQPSPFQRWARPVSVADHLIPSDERLRVRVYQPSAHSATILLNGGFVPESIDDPRLINFATALAETGFLVLTPDYPAVRESEFTPVTIDQIVGVIRHTRQSAAWGGSRPLALVGLSYVGTLSLKAALRPDLDAPPEFLGVFGGYANFADLMCEVFQDTYHSEGVEVPVDPYGRFLVLRSMIDYFLPPPEERDRIRAASLAIGRRRPLAEIDALVNGLSPEGRACIEALRAFRPDRSTERWHRMMQESRAVIEALSIDEPVERLRSQLVILHSVYDHILPCAGSVALHRRFPTSTLVLTRMFTHVNPRLSPTALWSQGRELRALLRIFGDLMALQR